MEILIYWERAAYQTAVVAFGQGFIKKGRHVPTCKSATQRDANIRNHAIDCRITSQVFALHRLTISTSDCFQTSPFICTFWIKCQEQDFIWHSKLEQWRHVDDNLESKSNVWVPLIMTPYNINEHSLSAPKAPFLCVTELIDLICYEALYFAHEYLLFIRKPFHATCFFMSKKVWPRSERIRSCSKTNVESSFWCCW